MSVDMGDNVRIKEKLNQVRRILKDLEKVVVAFSGGVDSTLLLKLAYDNLGKNAIGIYVDSLLQPEREKQEAHDIAQLIGAEIYTIKVNPLQNETFSSNSRKKCYFCKSFIFDQLIKEANARGFRNIVDGSNHDDTHDYRPGKKALIERNIRSPLQEAGLTKEEIRIISKKLNLSTWNKDAYACLASRIPYGTKITPERLKQIDEIEQILIKRGYRNVRARYFDDEVRVEVRSEQVKKLQAEITNQELLQSILSTGFTKVYIDPEGYRQGSLNKFIDK